jgi:hypothetical protein
LISSAREEGAVEDDRVAEGVVLTEVPSVTNAAPAASGVSPRVGQREHDLTLAYQLRG